MSTVPGPEQPDTPPDAGAVPPAPPAYPQQPVYGQQPAYGQPAPGYPVAPGAPPYGPPPGGYATAVERPGRTMGIVAFILSLAGLITSITALVGLILGVIAMVQSRHAGQKNGLALAAVIIGGALILLSIIGVIVLFAFLASLGSAVQACSVDPSQVVNVWGIPLDCSRFAGAVS